MNWGRGWRGEPSGCWDARDGGGRLGSCLRRNDGGGAGSSGAVADQLALDAAYVEEADYVFGVGGELEVGEDGEQGVEDGAHFPAGEVCAEAEVLAVAAEGEMVVGLAADVELVGASKMSSSRLAEGYQRTTDSPLRMVWPRSSTSSTAVRWNWITIEVQRRISSTAEGTSSGCATRSSS